MNKTNNHYCTLYLVRHGETEWNVMDKIQGQLDSNLTPAGEVESVALAEKLREIHFDAIFTSDLSRTIKTAEILKLNRMLAIETKKALLERTFSVHDGSLGKDYAKAIRHLLKHYESLSYRREVEV